MSRDPKKWPYKTVQVFCSATDDPTRVPVVDSIEVACSDCGIAIMVERKSLTDAAKGAPGFAVRCLCIACGVQYEFPHKLIDRRGLGQRLETV